ncbi:MAG: YheU family protein [Alcanivoracaceae bacterium]|nr:YheU family protein [Alcanivoracaceae bacterium]
MIVPWEQVPAESLRNLVEEFVTRDGTDYGEQEVSLETRVGQVMQQLRRAEVVIWFDDVTETITLMTARDARDAQRLAEQSAGHDE